MTTYSNYLTPGSSVRDWDTGKTIVNNTDSILKIPGNLTELKALCPPDLKGIERSTWIAQKRAEYGI